MSWHLRGHVLIACNCDWGCPCNFNAPPTSGDCEGGWIWAIGDGAIDGVDVSGQGLAVFADWPGAIHDGGGVASAYLDDRADDAQTAALTRLLRGDLGGPWAIFINTYSLAGPHRASFDISLAGHASTAVIDDVADLELDHIHNPVTGVEGRFQVTMPAGIVLNHAEMAASKRFRVHGDVEYDHSGKYAAFGEFQYSG